MTGTTGGGFPWVAQIHVWVRIAHEILETIPKVVQQSVAVW